MPMSQTADAAPAAPAARVLRVYDAQNRYMRSRSFLRGFVGGRGAGKTRIGCIDLMARAGAAPAGRMFALYAPSYKTLQDATLRTFFDLFRADYVEEWNRGDNRIELRTGQTIIARSLDDPESARGPNLSGAWMDEASLVGRDAFNIIIAALREGGERGWLGATFTPKGPTHWTAEVFGSPDNSDAYTVRASSRDNPFLPPGFVDFLARQYTSAFAQQEIDGQFVDLTGACFRREWFRVVGDYPRGPDVRMVRHWDLAATEPGRNREPDYTAGALLAYADGVAFVVDVQRGQLSPLEVERLIAQTAAVDGRDVRIGIEQEGGASGKSLCDHLRRNVLAGYVVDAVHPTGSKLARALPWAAAAEAGNVRLVSGPWVKAFLDEATTFPGGAHDDQVDAVSGAHATLTGGYISSGGVSVVRGRREKGVDFDRQIGDILAKASGPEERAELLRMLEVAT